MSKKITQEEYVARMEIINPNILIRGTYLSMKNRIEVECKVCGNIWNPTADKLIYGRGCPNCKAIAIGNRCRMSQEEFITRMNIINPHIEILSDYINGNTYIKCKCKIDGYIWLAKPSNLLYQKSGCPKCAHCQRRTSDEFRTEMLSISPNIDILSDFNGVENKVKCRCKIDENIWYATPHELLNGTGCPVCSESKGEKSISLYLDNHKISYESQKKFDGLIGTGGGLLSYDFYLPNQNLLIEYQGAQHERPYEYFGGKEKFIKQQEHDRRKRVYAQSYGFDLLEIWHGDYKNIEQILDDKLLGDKPHGK